ncbi:uncharacterized protein LOC127254373 [Andrographis paniculata]|uniref:uncharacterized protein LOC127254373 n=1 Tax=Andrographis paniculata TaxID=175694 RepID=UPI0021E85BA6|nr:uncharacterized protein LOC127254373 [Andrographis paniculata]
MANQYVPALPFDGTDPLVPFVASRVLTPTVRPYCTTNEDADRMKSVISQVSPMAINDAAFKPERLLDSIRTHLTDPKYAYRKWHKRLLPHFEEQWRRQCIDKAILLLTQLLHLHDKALLAMAAFWHSQMGVFFLPSGPIGPTLMDVAIVAHLPIVGDDPVLVSFEGRELSPDHAGWALARLAKKERGWTSFITKFSGEEGTPMSELEHTTFLLFWLCRYIILSPFKLVLSSQVDLAIHLANGQFFSLGTLFLANLFEGLSLVSTRLTDTKKVDTAASGPFWFLELWLRLYFPTAFFGRLPVTPNPQRSIGLALAKLTPISSNLHPSDPVITQILTEDRSNSRHYVYNTLIQYTTELFWLYPDTPYPRSYPDPLPHPTYPFSWDSSMKPRSLFSSKRSDKKNYRSFYTFNYQPQFLARQFGCCQGLPGSLARPHLIPQSPEGLVILELIPTYLSQLTDYITSNSYLPFRPNPSAAEAFSTDRPIGRETYSTLGSPRLASALRRKRPAPAEGGSGAKKKKQKATPTIDKQAIEEYLASLPVDTSGLPKYLREEFETPSPPLTTAPTISKPTAAQPTDPQPIDPQLTTTQPTDPQPTAAQPTDPQPTAAQPSITLTSSQPTATPTAAPADILIEPLTTQTVGPSANPPTAGRPTTTIPTPLQVEDNSSPSSVAPQPTPIVAEGELPMIRRPEEPAGRQIFPQVLPSPQPSQDPGVVVAVLDQIVALPDLIAELPVPVVAPPDHAAALPLQPAARPVGERPPAAPQLVQLIPAPHDIHEISSSKSGKASVNFALRVSGAELAVAHRLQPADESIVGPMTRHDIPMAFRIMSPSEATTIFNKVAQEMNVLAQVNLPTPARSIIARCADLSFADLSPADLVALIQVAIDLLVQPSLESEAFFVLDRMMARLTEL